MKRELKDEDVLMYPFSLATCCRVNPDEKGTESSPIGHGSSARSVCCRVNPDEKGTERPRSASVPNRSDVSCRVNPDEKGTESTLC